MQTHTPPPHTHTPYAILPEPHAHELAAEQVICDAFTLGGRENLVQFLSVRIYPSFMSWRAAGIGTIFWFTHKLWSRIFHIQWILQAVFKKNIVLIYLFFHLHWCSESEVS